MFTHRHMEAIAATIAALTLLPANKLWVAERFADTIKASNARFDRRRFMIACGMPIDS